MVFLQTVKTHMKCYTSSAGHFPAILGKGPWPKLGKNERQHQNWEKIKDKEHNKGSKIYPQNQVILDCIMPSIPLSKAQVLKYHSDMGHCFS